MGVVISRWVWLESECIGVVSGYCCMEIIYKFPHITYPYSTCISTFFATHPYFFVHLKKILFFRSCINKLSTAHNLICKNVNLGEL